MIRVTDIHKSFGTLEVLKGVSLDVAQGEVVSIVGASGAGKTTLLQIIGTLSRPDGGRVEIDGRDVSALGDRALSQFRNERIGFVFQFHHLLAEFTAFENVCIPGLIGRRPRADVERRASELLDMMGLAARRDHKPGQLSGGDLYHSVRRLSGRVHLLLPGRRVCQRPDGQHRAAQYGAVPAGVADGSEIPDPHPVLYDRYCGGGGRPYPAETL